MHPNGEKRGGRTETLRVPGAFFGVFIYCLTRPWGPLTHWTFTCAIMGGVQVGEIE